MYQLEKVVLWGIQGIIINGMDLFLIKKMFYFLNLGNKEQVLIWSKGEIWFQDDIIWGVYGNKIVGDWLVFIVF